MITISNEELALKIQDGDQDLILRLWEQVRGFVVKQAQIRLHNFPSRTVDEDDLIQAGFVAMMEALQSYRNDMECGFIGWLAFHLKTSFNETIGIRTERQKRDPLHHCLSLDAPISDDDPDLVLGDTVADPNDPFEECEREIWLEQLGKALDAALRDLPEDKALILRRRYFDGDTLAEIAEDMNASGTAVKSKETKGLRRIRTGRHGPQLEQFNKAWAEIDRRTPWFYSVSVERYHRTRLSAVEMLAIRREGMFRDLTRSSRYVDNV